MVKKVLITGISGFAGSFLADFLLTNREYEVSGTYLSQASLVNLKQNREKLHLFHVNLTNQEETMLVVEKAKPDFIFHLAAIPAVGASFDRPAETITNNITAQLTILEAVRKIGLSECKILVVSSADMYGRVSEKELPIDEKTNFYPTNAYAVSKIAQDFLGLQYFLSYDLCVIRARPFNHMGPRQSTGFVIADFAQKIAEIEKGKMEPVLRVGNLESKRDFTDVRDIVSAYTLLVEKGQFGEAYNIGSGTSYKINDILTKLLSFAKVKISVEQDEALFRPKDSLDRVCNNSKFVALTGWKPTIPLEKTLQETLDYWRDIV